MDGDPPLLDAGRINPGTNVANAVRALMLGNPAGEALIRSTAWIAATLIVFAPLTVRAYERR